MYEKKVKIENESYEIHSSFYYFTFNFSSTKQLYLHGPQEEGISVATMIYKQLHFYSMRISLYHIYMIETVFFRIIQFNFYSEQFRYTLTIYPYNSHCNSQRLPLLTFLLEYDPSFISTTHTHSSKRNFRLVWVKLLYGINPTAPISFAIFFPFFRYV